MNLPNLQFVLLFVQDPIKSSEFYQKIFGYGPEELHPTFALFTLANGVKLGLWSQKTAEPKVTAQPGAAELSFSEEAVDALYAKWQKMGVKMAQEPTDMDFGRTFVALDPDGHRLRVHRLKA